MGEFSPKLVYPTVSLPSLALVFAPPPLFNPRLE